MAKLSIERAKTRAPYAGIVVARHAQPGAYLNIGSPVVTSIQDTSLEIEADIPVEQSAKIEPDLSVRAVRSGGAEVNATVRAVVPEDPLTRTSAVASANTTRLTINTPFVAPSSQRTAPVALWRMPISKNRRTISG